MTGGPPPRVYLAGPEVFLPPGGRDAVAEGKRQICEEHGLEGVFPGAPDQDPHQPGPVRAAAFFDVLVGEIDGCVAGIANLTPFRGPSADVGTVWEVGYLIGQGKPVVGYTNVAEPYGARAAALDQLLVEDFDLMDNLMVDRGVLRSNGGVAVVRSAVGHTDPERVLADLAGFRRCAEALALLLSAG